MDNRKFFLGMTKGWQTILFGLFASVFLVVIIGEIVGKLFPPIMQGDMIKKTWLLALILFGFFVWAIKCQTIKPNHVGVLEVFGALREVYLPQGDVWVPPFCRAIEVNVGSRDIDLGETSALSEENWSVTLTKEFNVKVTDPYKFLLGVFSMGGEGNLFTSLIGFVKSKIRTFAKTKPLLGTEAKDAVMAVLGLVDLKDELANYVKSEDGGDQQLHQKLEQWGLSIDKLTIRKVSLPAELQSALDQGAVEIAQVAPDTQEAETFGMVVCKLAKIVKNIKITNPELETPDLWTLAQMLQQRTKVTREIFSLQGNKGGRNIVVAQPSSHN